MYILTLIRSYFVQCLFNILSHLTVHNDVHNSCICISLTWVKTLTVIISVLCLCVNCILSCSGTKPTRSKSGIANFLKYFLFVVLIVIHLFSGSAFTEYTDNGYGRFLILHSRLLLVILLHTNGCKHTKNVSTIVYVQICFLMPKEFNNCEVK